MSSTVVGFAGLSHLGIVSAAATASKNLRVVAFDPDPARVRSLRTGRTDLVEPGLEDLLQAHRQGISWTDDASGLKACDVVYLSSDVATDKDLNSDFQALTALVATILPELGIAANLVVLSQVSPGFTRRIEFPKSRLFYQVETLVFGHAVARATIPERFIVGCANPHSPLPASYASVLELFDCPVLQMRYESAELAKMAINCYLGASVSVTNTLANLCEHIGADWSEIVPGLRLDRRIGAHAYLVPGLGLAGGHLERDMSNVLKLAASTGTESGVIAAIGHNSRHRRDWVLRTLHTEVLASVFDPIICVLGLAYKEGTASTTNSPGLALLEQLSPWRTRVYDPVVPVAATGNQNGVGYLSALEAVQGAHAVAIMTPWPGFRSLKATDLVANMAGHTLLDPMRVMDEEGAVAAGLDYFTLGKPPTRRIAK